MFCFFALLIPCESKSQESIDQIMHLKTGALIIRLHSKEKSISAYQKAEKNELAEKIRKKQFAFNKIIIRAFKNHFNFCTIYFIYSDHTQEFINDTNTRIFLNDTGVIDSSISFKENYFLFADHDKVYPEIKNGDSITFGSSPVLNNALVIKDQKLIQLLKPFPFFTPLPFRESSFKKGVIKLNRNLHSFYNEQQKQ